MVKYTSWLKFRDAIAQGWTGRNLWRKEEFSAIQSICIWSRNKGRLPNTFFSYSFLRKFRGDNVYNQKAVISWCFLQLQVSLWPRAGQWNVNRNYWILYLVRLLLDITDSFFMGVLPFPFSWSPAYSKRCESWYLGSTFKGTHMMDIASPSIQCIAQNQNKITLSFQISPPSFLPPPFLIGSCTHNWHTKNCTYLRCTNW